MNRPDTTTRRVTTGIVLAVALFAAGDSFSHIYDLARLHGQGVVSAALLPLAGDGLVAAASSAMLAAARNGTPVPLRARLLLFGGIGATIAANVAYGLSDGLTGALLSVWPVAAYVGCIEILSWMRQHLGVQPKVVRTASRATVPAASQVLAPDALPDAADELSDRREQRTRQPVTDLLRAAEDRFPDRLPSLREIQGAMSVGQARAQTVQAHLRTRLAPTG